MPHVATVSVPAETPRPSTDGISKTNIPWTTDANPAIQTCAVEVTVVLGGTGALFVSRIFVSGQSLDSRKRYSPRPRKVDIRLPGKGDSNSHGARPVHQKHRWTRTSRLSIKNSLSMGDRKDAPAKLA